MDILGILGYLASFTIVAGIYAVASLGLNIQFGFTGLYNFGIAAFYAIGAYTAALITGSPSSEHIGGFNLPILIGIVGAMVISGLLAYLIGIPTLRLRGEFLGISTLGVAETIRLFIKNEKWLTGGVWGLGNIPKPLHGLTSPKDYIWIYLALVIIAIVVVYLLIRKAVRSPWGRVLKSIREDEVVTAAMGKDVYKFKMQSLIFGAMLMGLAGALYAHYVSYISPQVFKPLMGTFIIWAMLIAGGSGNNKGAVLGAYAIWGVWVFTEFITDLLPATLASRAGYINIVAIAIIFQLLIRFRPQGLLREKREIKEL